MRYVLMTAKKAGKCTLCAGDIVPGDKIRWARGSGASHVNCETARLRHTLCTVCKGSGRLWNNAPCRQCDGSGSREMEERAKTHDFLGRKICPDCHGNGGFPAGGRAVDCHTCHGTGTLNEYPQPDPMGVDAAYEDDCARRCGL